MRKPTKLMTEADLVEALGEPDEIVPADSPTRIMAIEWVCSTCFEAIYSEHPIPPPAPCPRCGGITFERVR
jgi:hypothetical protein